MYINDFMLVSPIGVLCNMFPTYKLMCIEKKHIPKLKANRRKHERKVDIINYTNTDL